MRSSSLIGGHCGTRAGRGPAEATGGWLVHDGADSAGKAFNKANPGLNVKLIEFSESADEQRNQFVQRQEAKAADCDVFYSDIIWTAEFAQQRWLYDMTPYVKSRAEEFIPSTLATITYQDKQSGASRTDECRLPLLPHRPGRQGAGDVTGGQRHRRQERRHRLPGGVLPAALRRPRFAVVAREHARAVDQDPAAAQALDQRLVLAE